MIVESVFRAQQEHHNDKYGYDVLTDGYNVEHGELLADWFHEGVNAACSN